MFMSVVLPEPDAPIRATSSPRRIENDTPRKTGTSISPTWYVLVMFSHRISSMDARVSLDSLLATHPRRSQWVVGLGRNLGNLFAQHHDVAGLQGAADHFGLQAISESDHHVDRVNLVSLPDPNTACCSLTC